MRHFGYLSASDTDALFEAPPEQFDRDSGTELLSVALGATLYMPADRPALAADITKQAGGRGHLGGRLPGGLRSPTSSSPRPRRTWSRRSPSCTTAAPGRAAAAVRPGPRRRRRSRRWSRASGPRPRVLDGFVLPKFTAAIGTAYLHALDEADRRAGPRCLAMPVLESGAVLYAETRVDELTRLRALLHRDRRPDPRRPARRHRPLRRSTGCAARPTCPSTTSRWSRPDRRRRQRARPGRRHRLHRHRPGLGVLRRRRAHLQAAAAAVARSPSTTRPSCAASWSPGRSTG